MGDSSTALSYYGTIAPHRSGYGYGRGYYHDGYDSSGRYPNERPRRYYGHGRYGRYGYGGASIRDLERRLDRAEARSYGGYGRRGRMSSYGGYGYGGNYRNTYGYADGFNRYGRDRYHDRYNGGYGGYGRNNYSRHYGGYGGYGRNNYNRHYGGYGMNNYYGRGYGSYNNRYGRYY